MISIGDLQFQLLLNSFNSLQSKPINVKLRPASDYNVHGMYDGSTQIHFALAVLSVSV